MTRRVWFARDCWLTADPKVERLGDRHGAAGILALEEIMALAKLADQRGEVVVAYSTLVRRAWLKSVAQARQIIDTLVELGLVESTDNGPREAKLSIPRWARWQVKDPTAAERQSRRRDATDHAKVTDLQRDNRVTNNRDVTPPQLTEEQNPPQTPPPAAPSGGRKRDRHQFEQDFQTWATEHFSGWRAQEVRDALDMVRLSRREPTVDLVGEKLRERAAA